MRILKRLLKEFWFPTVVAITWTIYNAQTSTTPWNFKSALNVFGPTFFLISWATGQFFRVQKQTQVEQNFTSIEDRVNTSISKLEQLTRDFFGYTTGAESVAYFTPILTDNNTLELGLMNKSIYPVFDVFAEVIDLDEAIDPIKEKLWTRHRYTVESLHPGKIIMGAYRFDLSARIRLNLNIFIRTRTKGMTQQLRLVKTENETLIAIKTNVEGKTIEMFVPANFPGADRNNPDATFA